MPSNSPNAKSNFSVIIIGGGQAGLSMSYYLKERGIDHVVFERDRIAESWRTKRWDSFCLVTPNWQCTLPGFHYSGNDPDGFMVKNDIVAYIEAYAKSFNPPVKEGVTVGNLRRNEAGIFEVNTSIGGFTANQVVVAVGGYHTPVIPRLSDRFPADIVQIHSAHYKNPGLLPPGNVLVVGTGQSGCQIAEDLHLAGRGVHLCVGGAPRTARRYRGKDVVAWLHEMGYYDKPIHEHPQKERVRAKANHYVTGRDGGRDIDLRKFALEGMLLHGRLREIEGTTLRFADDLEENLDKADSVSESIKTSIDEFIAANDIDAPVEERYRPPWKPTGPPADLDLTTANITSVIWGVGYRMDYRWIDLPLFDGKGYPGHERGVTSMPGVYFLGLPWQHTWGSGRFSGVAQDARFLADCIEARNSLSPSRTDSVLNEWALGS
ncbi:MAG TPA: MSMEG_0569 family flavin-dependent oxidoreductase [Chthoniobacterales bacterium]